VADDLTAVGAKIRRAAISKQWLDLIVAAAVGGAVWWRLPGRGVEELDAAARRALFQSTAGMALTLLGLTMATIGILAASIDKPISLSPSGLPPGLVRGLSRPMFGLIRVLGVTVLISLLLMVFDSGATSSRWVQPALVVVLVLSGLRVSRVLSLLSHLLRARTG
jgi:hypothetical protein